MSKPGVIAVVTLPLDVYKLAKAIGVGLPVISEREIVYGAIYADENWAKHYADANERAGNVRVVGRGEFDGKPAMIAVARAGS